MAGNETLIEHILEKMHGYVPDQDALQQLRSNLILLDQFGGDQAGAHLGAMLASVERAIEGLEAGSAEAALAEADTWGIAHLVRAALEAAPPGTPASVTLNEPRAFGARSDT